MSKFLDLGGLEYCTTKIKTKFTEIKEDITNTQEIIGDINEILKEVL